MDIRIVQTTQERADAFQIRRIVFINEQHVTLEEEMDAYDETAIHFIGYENGAPTAVSRLRLLGDYGKLERIAVVKEARGRSYGRQMIQAMEAVLLENDIKKAKLNAQTHAENFYKKVGYNTHSEEIFMDAGIPHVTMTKQL